MSSFASAMALLDAIGTHMTFHDPGKPTGLPTLAEIARALDLEESSAELLLQEAVDAGDVMEPHRQPDHYKLTDAGKAKWDEHTAASEP